MSASLIVSAAFFMCFIFSFKLLNKIIKVALDNKCNKNKTMNEEVEKFRMDVLKYYIKFSEKYKKLDIEVNKIVSEAIDKANDIVEHSKQQLAQTLDNSNHFHLKNVTDQVKKAIVALQADTANIAADAIKKIVQKHKSYKYNSKIISSLSHNLDKRFHK
ncbi:MAG: hypothetical protein LJI21_01055 [Wolbachia endosymbiont of Menacanthus eurysternus]|nr:MAG: hypothetical protein LJI21_01055 [Wolbachia endosymbiont of Menacanthus eurysternus]